MKAIVLEALRPIDQAPLTEREMPDPTPSPTQVVLSVAACGVCRSNLHMIEGDWVDGGTPSYTPIVPGHEVVGTISQIGQLVTDFAVGDRVGVTPLWSTCGVCEFCTEGRDQLCQSKEITGESVDGGYAELMLAESRHTYHLPDELDFVAAAPLFCPGITAYGSVSKANLAPGKRVAVFGMGGVGHMVVQMAALSGADVFVVSRGKEHLSLATELGAVAVDATSGDPGEALQKLGGMDSCIVFAPSSAVVDQAIAAARPGGTVVIGVNAEVGPLPFAEEKTVVGSLLGTRQQVRDMLQLASAGKIAAQTVSYDFDQATAALTDLKDGKIRARAVLVV